MSTSQHIKRSSASSAVPRIAVILGTRPEYLKLAPVIAELKRHGNRVQPRVILTGQHRELLDGLSELFGIAEGRPLEVRNAMPDLPGLTGALLQAMTAQLEREPCDAVVVQGDTTTAFCAALAAFYQRIPVAHVEAGLRTHDPLEPFPEEMNRQLVSRLARWHFPPTLRADANLARENIAAEAREVTGNTIVDTLQFVLKHKLSDHYAARELARESPDLAAALEQCGARQARTLALLTIHRRENQGHKLSDFFEMMRDLAQRYPDHHTIYPYHLNPEVRDRALAALSGLANFHLVAPLSYRPMLLLMKTVDFALSDSGGIQEELPTLGKPLLVLRNTTERPEIVEAKMAKLVGVEPQVVAPEVETLIACARQSALPDWYVPGPNPFGDGQASKRIVRRLMADLGAAPGQVDSAGWPAGQ